MAALDDPDLGLDAALTSLSGRIRLHEGGDRTPEAVIAELWQAVLASEQAGDGAADPGKANAPSGASRPTTR